VSLEATGRRSLKEGTDQGRRHKFEGKYSKYTKIEKSGCACPPPSSYGGAAPGSPDGLSDIPWRLYDFKIIYE